MGDKEMTLTMSVEEALVFFTDVNEEVWFETNIDESEDDIHSLIDSAFEECSNELETLTTLK